MSVQHFRKKPVVIEAVRYLPGETCQDVAEFMGVDHDERDCFDDAEWAIETLEVLVFARPGDWIVRGVQGEFYPCKPDIFDATYEAADTPSLVVSAETVAEIERLRDEAGSVGGATGDAPLRYAMDGMWQAYTNVLIAVLGVEEEA